MTQETTTTEIKGMTEFQEILNLIRKVPDIDLRLDLLTALTKFIISR